MLNAVKKVKVIQIYQTIVILYCTKISRIRVKRAIVHEIESNKIV